MSIHLFPSLFTDLLLFHGPVNRINVRTLKLSKLLATAASWDPERTKGSPLSKGGGGGGDL